MNRGACLFVVGLAGALAGCGGPTPAGALVLTQVPPAPAAARDRDTVLDVRYPPGSRVVLALPPLRAGHVRLLSQGLQSAGNPIVSADGQRIFFVGKAGTSSAWQIFEARLNGGWPRAVTALDGGAMDPALLPNGDLVFASPVPKVAAAPASSHGPALFAQTPRGTPRRLTFGAAGAADPTVLRDGRILFVSAQPPLPSSATPRQALFTVNNDGTELTAYAGQHDGAGFIRRPRELEDGYLAFLVSDTALVPEQTWVENVRTARPFLSRERILSPAFGICRSIEPAGPGKVLVALNPASTTARSPRHSYAIYQIARAATTPGAPLFDDPNWDNSEASFVAPHPQPTGHLSTVDPTRTTGLFLCLNANRTTTTPAGQTNATAVRVRVLGIGEHGATRSLGETAVQTDGSFLAEVPADVPLGFETLDAQGHALSRLPPSIWVRPGAIQSCPGCHAPHGRALENRRPLAVMEPPARMGVASQTLAQGGPPR